MILKDLISFYSWPSVETELIRLYPDQENLIHDYENIFNDLKLREPKAMETQLYIQLVKDADGDYVDVSGIDFVKETQRIEQCAIEFKPWDEWLGMVVTPGTLTAFTEIEIIVHALYEMTFISFDEKEILDSLNHIKDLADEAKKSIKDGDQEQESL